MRGINRAASMGVALTAVVLGISAGGTQAFAATSGKRVAVCEHRHGGGVYLAKHCARHDKRLKWAISGGQGPGSVEYTYNSTAPAATYQNSQLGPAGPFSELTGSCTVTGNIVEVTLGATNSDDVQIDETRTNATNGGSPLTSFESFTQPATGSPAPLLGEANDDNLGDGYNQTTMTVAAPVHGQLQVFEHVSHANNTCHLSVVWTPAS